MFKFSELKSIHLEISNNCQASCPMCPRKYHGGVENKNLILNDWTYEDFTAIFTSTVYEQLEIIYFCGNFGDPILNDDLIKMCQHIKDNAPHIDLRIHTNGAARNTQWWKDLYQAMPQKHKIFFALDGLEDTHHLYRIGTKYEQVIRNSTTFIKEGGDSEWVFIKFKHNEHQVEEAERRSKLLGFNSFTVKNTTRFIADKKYHVVNEKGEIIYYLEPPTENKVIFLDNRTIMNHEKVLKDIQIECYVLNTKEIYIDAHKHVFPCCFLASAPYQYRPSTSPNNDLEVMVNKFHDKTTEQYHMVVESLGGIDNIDATKHSIDEILSRDNWQTVWEEYWTTNILYTCGRVCGKLDYSKPKDQFIKRVRN